jgi:hypothetical protein
MNTDTLLKRPIRERLRDYIKDKGWLECNIQEVAATFDCPITSIYVPIRELEDEGLLKFIRGKKRFTVLAEQGSIYWYQPLFDLMNKEHNKFLLKSEMDDIITVVQKMLTVNTKPKTKRHE